ncbi:hypothetical protein DFH27DRAFT_524049 [Peziza echinospora]|nr:hypothetical protein DFH27DRAFT_524049 [Peziza echinospora]
MTEQHVSYMTKEQLEKYLRDLRTNRPARPTGSRPLPPSVYQQKRMAAAAAEAASSSSLPSTPTKIAAVASPVETSPAVDRRTSRLGRDDSHRRTRTTGSVTFASTTTEFPPETDTTLEDGLGDLSLRDTATTAAQTIPPHRRTKSAADWEMQQGNARLTDREKIDRELHERFDSAPAPIAPLKITKTSSGSSPSYQSSARTPYQRAQSADTQQQPRNYSPSPSRYVYNDPNQFNKVTYTTNPVPLPSPPLEGGGGGSLTEDRREGGTREERGRPPLPTIKVKKQPSEPPVIAVVEAPLSNFDSRNITPPSRQSVPSFSFSGPQAPSISVSAPSISVSGPSIPSIYVDGDDGDNGVPSIKVSGDNGNGRSSTPTQPPPAPAAAARRPLPTPVGNPFRKGNGSTARSSSVYSNASSAGRPGATCTTCATQISGRIVSALGARFHPECFRCYHCSEKLEHVGFFPEPEKNRIARAEAARCAVEDLGQRFYCHLDFHEKFSPRCKHCKTPIETEAIIACGETWHAGHFFCAECGDPFQSDTRFVEKDKYAWCLGCYNKRYSSKCRKCKQPVTETVVKALGGEWHVECFCCAHNTPHTTFAQKQKNARFPFHVIHEYCL